MARKQRTKLNKNVNKTPQRNEVRTEKEDTETKEQCRGGVEKTDVWGNHIHAIAKHALETPPAPSQVVTIESFHPNLPWLSVPDADFPKRALRRRRRKIAHVSIQKEDVILPKFYKPITYTKQYAKDRQSFWYPLHAYPSPYWLRRMRRDLREDAVSCSTIEPRAVDHDPAEKTTNLTADLYSELPIFPSKIRGAASGTEIRLLTLLPTSMGESMFCNMHRITLQDKPKFVALSYAWGVNEQTHRISVRGYEIPVTENLYQALMHLRKPDKSVVIWVDAVCIDQSNIPERNYQVSQMSKIYSAAEEVVAWLGSSTLESDCAMELITRSPEDLRTVHRPDLHRYLKDLFSRSYWRRVWVVQELASAQRTKRACTIRCGYDSVTLDQLRNFLRRIFRQTKIPELKAMMQPKTLMSLSAQDPSRTFLQILWESASLEATNPCDRIYGVRGISPKFYRDNIEVDYSKENTFEVLSAKVMNLMIKKERSLDVLCYFQRYTRDQGSPSWLRDFRKRNPGMSPDMYSANKGRKANAEIVNHILRARGVCIGHVAETRSWNKTKAPRTKIYKSLTGFITLPLLNRNHNLKLHSELGAIEDLASSALKKLYPNQKSLWEGNRFLEIVIGGKQQAIDLGDKDRARWQHAWNVRVGLEKGMISKDEWDRCDEFFCSTFSRLFGRSMFTTTEGNLGLGPRDMQTDDLVCVLYGCRLPVILRKDGRFYTFVGPAYVDGAMNGEFVDECDKADRFWIR
ncbi:Nn.00g066880.m01.CDS01 [Neocucurbitaria sp. VM-36]